ncbi:MAG TPA: GatB/YqeY domain-containing protein [Ignavibacteriaceae bacterium]|nr:GatB/YqeY domain-containing protein [Ignavibacteriaceae bacterium]
MSLKDKINNDLKEAMKSGDKTRLAVVRSIRALILEFEKSGVRRDLNNEDELQMLTTAAKKRKDSIEQFRNAGRNDLADQEEAELKILQEYLPKQLNEDEIKAEVARLASQIGAKSKEDFPKLMPLVMKELKGKADGKIVKSIVENFLVWN